MAAGEKLSAGQRSKIRRLSAPRELSPDEEGGELNIVPFLDIIMNVLMFVLATIAVTFTAMIDVAPSRSAGGQASRDPTQQALEFTVAIDAKGLYIYAEGGKMGPGCNAPATGDVRAIGMSSSVMRKDYFNGDAPIPDYDFAALTDCATKLKNKKPDYAKEHQATITANPDIYYQAIIQTVDAIRLSKDGKPLFDDVVFAIP